MVLRLAVSTGLVLLGYYVGREMGRTEPIRRELCRHREQWPQGDGDPTEAPSDEGVPSPPPRAHHVSETWRPFNALGE